MEGFTGMSGLNTGVSSVSLVAVDGVDLRPVPARADGLSVLRLDNLDTVVVSKQQPGFSAAALEGVRQIVRDAHAGLMGRLKFLVQLLPILALGQEQVAVQPPEIAINALLRDDFLDLRHGCLMAFGRKPCAPLAMQALQLHIPVVQRKTEMGGGAARFAAGENAVLKHYNRTPFLREKVRRRQACDSATHNADIGPRVLRESRADRDVRA